MQPMPEPLPRLLLIAIYLRVSTNDQAKRGFSLPEQRDDCRARAKTLASAEEQRTGRYIDLQIVEFVDAVSGELLERPELDRVRSFVREHRPAYFVCLDPDRFSRATHYAILVANEIESAGTKLEFVQHDYQANAEGKLFFTLRVAIAEYEKSKILERSLRGKRGKIKEGKLPVGMHIFGYEYDKLTQEIHPHPTEAPWLQQIFAWASEGHGCQIIATRLNEAGVPTKRHAVRGSPWYRTTVSKILRNSSYIGEVQVNRYDTQGTAVQRQLPKDRRTRKITFTERPRSEWITIQIPPLISRDVWESVQVTRGDAAKRRAQQKSYLLTGIVNCGYCGAPVHYKPHPSGKHLLVCANRYTYSRGLKEPLPVCRSLPHQNAFIFEVQVWSHIEEWLTKPGSMLAYLEKRQVAQNSDEPQESSLATELQLIERQLAQKQHEQVRVLTVVASGSVDPDVAAAALKPYTEQINNLRKTATRLRDRLGQVAKTHAQYHRTLDRVRVIRETLSAETAEVKEDLADLDDEGRQQMVRQLVHEVRIYRDGVCEIDPLP